MPKSRTPSCHRLTPLRPSSSCLENGGPTAGFVDGALRQVPKYDRRHCRLLRALYGHPEAGALWGFKLEHIMKNLGWSSIPGNGGVYVHAKTKVTIVVYVDDMLLLPSPQDTDALWRDLEKKVDYKDPASLFNDISELFITSTPLTPKSQRRPAAY